MKTYPILSSAILAALVLLPAGVSSAASLVLDPVGPPALPSATAAATGTLMVFSAFNPNAPRAGDPENRQRYTDYQIFSADGRLLRNVSNDAGLVFAAPLEVKLPPGAYRVSARANGYRSVQVPVIIAEGRATAVHLEGGNSSGADPASAVRLPNGQIVGWRASL